MARELVRHRGRRTPATDEATTKHKRLIAESQRKERELQTEIERQKRVTAERIDRAMFDGVQTQEIAKWMGLSRQGVYKIVATRLDGKDLNGNAPTRKRPVRNESPSTT